MSKARVERIGRGVTFLCIGVVSLLAVALVALIAQRGLAVFISGGADPVRFFTGASWAPRAGADGVLDPSSIGAAPMLVGSLAVTLISCLIAAPLAIGSAIFAVEIAPGFGRAVFRPIIEVLVGIPSVVYGLIGVSVVLSWVRSWADGTGAGILAGSLVLAVMVLPTITSLSIDALAAVPQAWREGAYGLGSTRWQMVHRVVVRASLPELATAIILGMTRAFGEALAVQMVIGNAAVMPRSLTTAASTLTSILTMGMAHEPLGTPANDVLWTLAALLLAVSAALIGAIHLVGRLGSLERV